MELSSQLGRRAYIGVLVVALLGLLLAAPAVAGTLKVTSMPSGALVIVDGVNTGKVTPMSIALSNGTHVITVLAAGPGWAADTRTVTITSGSHDMSVTLVPVLTAGPPGPPGPPGPSGMADATPVECGASVLPINFQALQLLPNCSLGVTIGSGQKVWVQAEIELQPGGSDPSSILHTSRSDFARREHSNRR